MAAPLSPALALALAAPLAIAAQSPPDAAPRSGARWAQVTVHERIIIRIPRIARNDMAARVPAPATAAPRWRERRGPNCVPLADLAGAAISDEGDIDLVTVEDRRLRAKLTDGCPPLNFYSGFYVKPSRDGKLCANRDVIRARSGRSCPIERFHRLSAAR